MKKIICFLFLFISCVLAQQETNKKGFILTDRLFLFDSTNGNQANNNGVTYTFNFAQNFTNTPRVGLAIFNMDFQYSPKFSCQVSGNTTSSSATLVISTSTTSRNNQLYIMFIATDHDFLGLFMPDPFITYLLNQGNPGLTTQSFPFNFKQYVAASQASNIRLSVYLTGIDSSSELVSNGYPTNHTYFQLTPKILNSTNYQIDVSVNSIAGDIGINQVSCTVIYFDTTFMQQFRYLMDKGQANLQNFGGTADQSTKSITLNPLPPNPKFSGLKIFFGISGLQCKQGATIALSASNQLYNNPSTNSSQYILTMYTFKLTYMISASYNFIQFQSLNCDLPGSNCDGNCLTSTQPHYIVNGVCNFCQSSCLTCNVTNSNSKCDTCDSTRSITDTGLCVCLPGYYDTLTSNVCGSCFPCLTCNLKGNCLSCSSDFNLTLNSILAICQCKPGFYPNYLSNSTNMNNTIPCLLCPPNCLYCLNLSVCLACNTITYLNSKGQCLYICNNDQKYNDTINSCMFSSSSMYDQSGRLGYEWSMSSDQSKLSIVLTFSQSDVKFYYYENQAGYSMENSGITNKTLAETANFYYDDGTNTQGYSSESSQISQIDQIGSMASLPSTLFNNSNFTISQKNSNAESFDNLFQQGTIIDSSINGSFYGLGERRFIKYLYQNYIITHNKPVPYTDIYGIPYGKYNLSINKPIKSQNYADALQKNIQLKINNETIPFVLNAKTNNQYLLTASVSKSYSGDPGFLILKNPALVRSGSTASQLWKVQQAVYIYYCAIPSYVSAANSIKDSNSIIVQVLWGLAKYPLFIGFGWVFMPLMLVLQYVMSLNYIDTLRPLNLNLFLQSFADFRNPSIFYNPTRNKIDKSVISHQQIYQDIRYYNRFDRGIDFLKNCFQFFFVPFLSVLLYGLFIGINKILNSFDRDIPLISQYLKPRFGIHIAAYTLVQALPVSFFFFAQLNDTRYSSPNQPTAAYPIFNVAMSYLAFFLTCSIPIIICTHIYFLYSTKQSKVKSAKDFKDLFINLLQSNPNKQHKSSINDLLWTGDQLRLISYGFGLSIYLLTILYGFFTSFFIDNYPWQIAGLVISTALLLAFAAVGDHFTSWLIRLFWIVFCALILAFLFLLAGIGSNASVAPCDQQNLGYLGIGFIYALILVALFASFYILWFTIYQIYNNYFKNTNFIRNLKEVKDQIQDKPERVKGFQSTSKIKSTYMKNPIGSQIGIGSKVNIGSMNMGGSMYGVDRNRNNYGEQELNTEDRMVIVQKDGQDEENSYNLKQKLFFYQIRPRTGEYVFITQRQKKQYVFDENIGRRLKQKQIIFIDNNEAFFDNQNQFLGNYSNLKGQAKSEIKEIKEVNKQESQKFTVNEREIIKKDGASDSPIIQYTSSRQLDDFDNQRRQVIRNKAEIKNIYIINGEEYSKQGQDSNGLMIMRNIQTNQIRKVSPSSFQNQYNIEEQNLEDNSLQKQLDNQNIIQKTQNNQNTVISEQILNNKVVLQKQRKFRYNNQDYIDLGADGSLFKLYNTTKKSLQKVTRQQYIKMTIKSFETRINLNGIDYDYDFVDVDQTVHLIQAYSKKPKIISQEQFRMLKQQNQIAFRELIGQQNPFKGMINQGKKLNEDVTSQINNLLLIQSKAQNRDLGTVYNSGLQNNLNIIKQTSTKTIKEVEMITIDQKNKKQVPAQNIQDQQDDEDSETIQKVIEKSPGPFQLFVVPGEKVEEIDGADNYDKQDAIQKIILDGKNVMQFMHKTEKKYPRAALFMVDMSNQQQYRLI